MYSHFASKDELVAVVLELSLSRERDFITACFADDRDELPGGVYLARIEDQYRTAASLRFLLRTAYAPPVAIRTEVVEHYRAFLADLERLFVSGLPTALSTAERDYLTQSYLGIVDSVQVELLYGDDDSIQKRHSALWRMLTHAAASVAP